MRMYTSRYPVINVTVDAIIYSIFSNDLLMIRRGNEPHKGKLALPGGFMNADETSKDACIRELREEIGLVFLPEDLELCRIADEVNRDPRGRTISIVYSIPMPDYKLAELITLAKAGDDAASVEFLPKRWAKDNPQEFAFDHYGLLFKEFLC